MMRVKEIFKKIINSRHLIIVGLLIIVAILLWFSNYLVRNNHTYTFTGRGQFVSIINGAISINHDTHLFVGSHITYIQEEDVIMSNFIIGYYIRRGLEMYPLIMITGSDEEGFSLRALLQHTSVFNLVEPAREGAFARLESVSQIANAEGLYFIIEGTTINGEEIYDLIPIDLVRISR